jgi:serine/threonine-protein kinase
MKICPKCNTSFPTDFQTCPRDQSVLRLATGLEPGMIIRDKYIVLNRIGSGGMATVYRVQHRAFDEIRAMKVVSAHLSESEDFLRRFRDEARITRKLRHPNAVWVEDLDVTDDGRPFIVMEYVKGSDLRSVVATGGRMPIPRALDIAGQVAAALGAAHDLGIVHRDIKPENILITRAADGSDLVKVTDFGIAKAHEGTLAGVMSHAETGTGMIIGTPQYMSPEQASGKRGKEIDGRSDLYSLALTLYEMLTGQLPFHANDPVGYVLAHLNETPVAPEQLNPDIPPSVSGIVMKALEKDPNRRFPRAEDMRRALLNPDDWWSNQEAITGSPQIPVTKEFPLPPARVMAASASGGSAVSGAQGSIGAASLGMAESARRISDSGHAVQVGEPASRVQPSFQEPPRKEKLGKRSRAIAAAVAGAVLVTAMILGGLYVRSVRRAPRAAASQESVPQTVPPASAGSELVTKPPPEPPSPADSRSGANADIASLLALAKRQADARNYAAAIKTFNKVLLLDNANAAARTGLLSAQQGKKIATLVSRGNKAIEAGEYAGAIAAFQEALLLDASDTSALAGLKRAQQAKKAEEAITNIRK